MEYRQISDPSVKVSIVSTASVYGVQMHTLSNGDKWSEAAFDKEFVCADGSQVTDVAAKPVSLIKPILKGQVR